MTSATSTSAFDLSAPLPTGTTVLEASAGTGKTYAIVGLATRFVAEGVAQVSELLLVTFSKNATQELRDRTRERFTVTARALADPVTARTSTDEVVAHLADADDETVAQRRRLLIAALSDFDAGTIATTHSFCQRMLDGLGIAGEREPDAVLVETVDDLASDVVDDLYLRTYGRSDEPPPITAKEARQVASAAIKDRHADLSPAPDAETIAGHRVIFAAKAREEVERRKRVIGVRDFDDLLVLLHQVLIDPAHGESACRRIRERFRVVLVDEFQDTDPLQWDILRLAFHDAGRPEAGRDNCTTLVLVGDPKQAIYAFRGAEVLSYLDAVKQADHHDELTVNWRSDPGVLTALEHLYGNAALGNDQIIAHPVQAHRTGARLTGQVPMRLRYLPRTGSGPQVYGFPTVAALRSRVAADVAADIVALLSSDSRITLGGHEPRPVAPGDIAVLTRTHAHVEAVRSALDRVGVPSVLAGGSSVFATASATHWLWLLQALEQPHRVERVRLAALTPLLGYATRDLDERGDDVVAVVNGRLREWSALFDRSGFAAVYERLAAQCSLDARLLALASGERALTDLRHVAQLLNRMAVEESFGLTALTRWLSERVADPASGGGGDRSRRLDSDSAAVQLATVHSSKGLEFPIVYVPYGWDGAKFAKPETLLFHDDRNRRVLDVGGPGSGTGYAGRKQLNDFEDAGEQLRLLYVALTRAMCQVVLWWAPSKPTTSAPLHRLLFGRNPGVAEPDITTKVLDDSMVASRLSTWASDAQDVISVEPVGPQPAATDAWSGDVEDHGDLAAASFRRIIDPVWRRTSYSALTAAAHDQPVVTDAVGSEAENPEKTDEPGEPPGGGSHLPASEPAAGIASPMNGLPAGPAFGTLVHEILEFIDTSVDDLEAELLTHCTDAVAARMADVEPAALAAALLPVLRTPLGFGTLAEITPENRLAEMDFEFPLAGGDDPVAAVTTLRSIAGLVRRHLTADDSLAGYADLLDELDDVPLRGYLTGSIDSVVRIPGPEPRYVVVDYKTNRLSRGELTTDNFTREKMAAEMLRAHYPLQALLYCVALHRYLRWRQRGYDPAVHLGGVQYHFVRGMVGPDTPPGCGVFDWNPPTALVTELSDLLSGVSA